MYEIRTRDIIRLRTVEVHTAVSAHTSAVRKKKEKIKVVQLKKYSYVI